MRTCLDLFKNSKIDPTQGKAPFEMFDYDQKEVLKIYYQRAKGKTMVIEQLINGDVSN